MHYLIIEHFRKETVKELYQRFDEKGRLMPAGLNYIDSWINEGVSKCYQLMESDSLVALKEWIANWDDLADFEIVPVISSDEVRKKVLNAKF
ncbi:MAG: hypothetical protein ACI8ZM_000129 [Crocinitomix sp.]|jgi:hypothetical protein